MRHQATGLLGVLRLKHFVAGFQDHISMRQVRAALEGAAKLAARHHFLAGVAAFFEVHTAYRLVIEHLWHQGLHQRRGNAGNAAAHLTPVPQLFAQNRPKRGALVHSRNPQRTGNTVCRVQHHQVAGSHIVLAGRSQRRLSGGGD